MSDYFVGVSGGIGSGKTTVTDLFAKQGIEIIDADVIARQVVEPGSPALKKIIAKFGDSIVDQAGFLQRAKLRELVFSDAKLQSWLNQLLHPLIRQQMVEQMRRAASPYCILSVPLLVENKLHHLVDRVLIVDVREETQLQRTLQRDQGSAAQIRAIMHAQAARQQRLAIADDVINNEGQPQDLLAQVEQLHETYLQLARKAAKA